MYISPQAKATVERAEKAEAERDALAAENQALNEKLAEFAERQEPVGWLCWNRNWNQPDRPSKWPDNAEFVPKHEGLDRDHAYTMVGNLYLAPVAPEQQEGD